VAGKKRGVKKNQSAGGGKGVSSKQGLQVDTRKAGKRAGGLNADQFAQSREKRESESKVMAGGRNREQRKRRTDTPEASHGREERVFRATGKGGGVTKRQKPPPKYQQRFKRKELRESMGGSLSGGRK